MLFIDRFGDWMDGLLLLSGIVFRTVAVSSVFI
jgi:hypothetical protein